MSGTENKKEMSLDALNNFIIELMETIEKEFKPFEITISVDDMDKFYEFTENIFWKYTNNERSYNF